MLLFWTELYNNLLCGILDIESTSGNKPILINKLNLCSEPTLLIESVFGVQQWHNQYFWFNSITSLFSNFYYVYVSMLCRVFMYVCVSWSLIYQANNMASKLNVEHLRHWFVLKFKYSLRTDEV